MSRDGYHLFFLRHGQADWPKWKGSDDDRPLTERGRKEMHKVAAYLAAIGLAPNKIFTSPLPRASQTAEIAAEYFKVSVELSDLLVDFNVEKLFQLMGSAKLTNVMVVGHEPALSTVVRHLTGADIKLKKAGVAHVRLKNDARNGKLHWLLSPELCKLK